MASTHSHGKKIAAFKKTDGEIYYVGYEKTCESNTYPRNPSWSCVFMGDYTEVVNRIFRFSASCEGGMLKGAGGRDIKSENYIAGWLRELANPLVLDDCEIQINTKSWRLEWNGEVQEKVTEMLSGLGSETADSVIETLAKGETAILSLHDDIDIIHTLCATGGVWAPWGLVDDRTMPDHTTRMAELGYAPKAVAPSVNLARPYYRISKDLGELLGQDAEGKWRNVGGANSVMASFICDLAKQELQEPGTYKFHIRSQREFIEKAKLAYECQPNFTITVNLQEELSRYKQDDLETLLQTYANVITETEARITIPTDADLRSLPYKISAQVTHWQEPATNLAPSNGEVQSSLFI